MPFIIAFISTDETKTASGTLKNANSAPAESKMINTAQSITPTTEAQKRLKRPVFAKQANATHEDTGQTNEAIISAADESANGSRRAVENEITVTNTAKSAETKNKGVASLNAASDLTAATQETTRHIAAKTNAPNKVKTPFETVTSDARRIMTDRKNNGVNISAAWRPTNFINGKSTNICNRANGVVAPP